jgi:hypothetical protein
MDTAIARSMETNVRCHGKIRGRWVYLDERAIRRFHSRLRVQNKRGRQQRYFFRTDNVKDPVQTGIEMQVYNVPRNPQPVKNDCGAVYDLLAPSVYADKPAGEWNHVVLTCDDNIITIDMNDVRIIDMNIDNWDTAGMNPDGTKNKFTRALKDFKREGYIGFQEHGDPVWFRNVKIKRL